MDSPHSSTAPATSPLITARRVRKAGIALLLLLAVALVGALLHQFIGTRQFSAQTVIGPAPNDQPNRLGGLASLGLSLPFSMGDGEDLQGQLFQQLRSFELARRVVADRELLAKELLAIDPEPSLPDEEVVWRRLAKVLTTRKIRTGALEESPFSVVELRCRAKDGCADHLAFLLSTADTMVTARQQERSEAIRTGLEARLREVTIVDYRESLVAALVETEKKLMTMRLTPINSFVYVDRPTTLAEATWPTPRVLVPMYVLGGLFVWLVGVLLAVARELYVRWASGNG